MRCNEICTLLEQEYSPAYACEWDNVGLLAGRREKEVKSILLALDATDEVVRMASEQKADMLITHHPMIFSPVRRVTDEDMIGRRLITLIGNDISYYAMHTNYDTRGMADLSAAMLGLLECTVLEEVKDGEGSPGSDLSGRGKKHDERSLKSRLRRVYYRGHRPPYRH